MTRAPVRHRLRVLSVTRLAWGGQPSAVRTSQIVALDARRRRLHRIAAAAGSLGAAASRGRPTSSRGACPALRAARRCGAAKPQRAPSPRARSADDAVTCSCRRADDIVTCSPRRADDSVTCSARRGAASPFGVTSSSGPALSGGASVARPVEAPWAATRSAHSVRFPKREPLRRVSSVLFVDRNAVSAQGRGPGRQLPALAACRPPHLGPLRGLRTGGRWPAKAEPAPGAIATAAVSIALALTRWALCALWRAGRVPHLCTHICTV